MATTTSLKLPAELRERAAAAARLQHLTPHAFMVQAIEQAAAAAEQRADFIAEAVESRRQALATGQGFDASEVHAYLRRRVAGQASDRPDAKPWRK